MFQSAAKTNQNHSPLRVGAKAPCPCFCGNSTYIHNHNFAEQRNSWGTSYKFNSKELDAETGLYYYGARYYSPDKSIWLSVDPMSDERPSLSPYNYCQLNPVMRVDPTGMLDWEPEIDGNGNTSYKAEKGDSKTTLKSQYGLSEEQASKILTDSKLPQNGEIKEGSKISGESVKKVTGSDVLKLDWASPQATDQRKVDQIMFGVKKSQVNGKDFLDLKDFNTNMYNGGAGFNAQNVTIKVGNERIPILNINLTNDWNTKMMSYGQPPKQIFGDNPSTIKQEFRDPTGRFGAPRMMIKMKESYFEKYRKYYY